MRPWVDGETVDLRLDQEVLQLPKVRGIVHLEDRDGAARAGDVDPAEPRINHNHVGAPRHRKMRDRPRRVEIKDGQRVVALAGQKRAAPLGVDGHAVIALAAVYAMPRAHGVAAWIDHGDRVLVLQVDVYLSGKGVVLR